MKEKAILDAARNVLKKIADIPIYFDHAREGITSPCFFASLTDVANIHNPKLVFHNCTLHITYFVPKHSVKTLQLCEMKDKLKDAFVMGMPVGDRYITFTSVSAELEGEDSDYIYFDAPFEYFEHVDEDGPDDLIMKIHERTYINRD